MPLLTKVLGVLTASAAAFFGQTPPPGASVTAQVQVPASMRTTPFNVARSLVIPPNFNISVYARIAGARFMAIASNGDLLVSHPGSGRVYLVRANVSGDPAVSTFASGLRNPHDMVFAAIGSNTYLYIAESHQINRYLYQPGDTVASNRQIIITGLPDASTPELGGSYGHQLKNIAFGSDGKLYVSIASTSNASASDAISDPVRCAIYQYNADGTGRRLFARGLRNAEGLAFVPGTSTLWVTVNQRDNIRFPFHADWNNDGSDDYGKLMQSYVDNHPPEAFTRVVDGGNYGWPYANPNPDTAAGLTNPPFDPDYDNNRDWTQFPESTFTRISKGIQAHSAPLGFSFLQGSAVAAEYRNGAAIALHGSWNRSQRTGYKIIYFPWMTNGTPGAQMDLVRGWLNDATQSVWGRPVDVVPDLAGNFLISDDSSGTIYKLSRTTAPPSGPQITALNVVNTSTSATVAALANGSTINLQAHPRVSIVAETAPGTSGSVYFEGSGVPSGGGEAVSFSRTENSVPYGIAGDGGPGAITAWDPPAGNGTYQLHVTAYAGAQRGGTAGTPRDVSFSVANGAQRVIRLSLINADTDQPIPGFHPIANGVTITLSQLPTRNLTFQTFTSPAAVGSVRMALAGPVSRNVTESYAPYALAGDASGNMHPLSPALATGNYTLSATPYTAASGGGTGGTVTTISFRVVN